MSLNTSLNSASRYSDQATSSYSEDHQDARSSAFKHLLPQVLGVMLFGAAILYGVGFASADVAHNAAHDTRHVFAFPCH